MMKLNRDNPLIVTTPLVVALLLLGLWVIPCFYRLQRLNRDIEEKSADLKTIQDLEDRLGEELNEISDFPLKSNRPLSNIALMSRLEKIIKKVGLSSRLEYMQPQTPVSDSPGVEELIVEVKMLSLNSSELIKFLYQLESVEKSLLIKNAVFETNESDCTRIDARIQVSYLYLR